MEQVFRRRAMQCLIVLDCNYRILEADVRLASLFANHMRDREPQLRLPAPLEQTLRIRLRRARQARVVWKGVVLVCASRLEGPTGECIVVSLEVIRTRAPLARAARRFLLSGREAEVLEYILRGLNASQIADRLLISKRTVGEYFKHLCTKIGAHNRAELVARVFDWEGLTCEASADTRARSRWDSPQRMPSRR